MSNGRRTCFSVIHGGSAWCSLRWGVTRCSTASSTSTPSPTRHTHTWQDTDQPLDIHEVGLRLATPLTSGRRVWGGMGTLGPTEEAREGADQTTIRQLRA